jgi:hypothetical protein
MNKKRTLRCVALIALASWTALLPPAPVQADEDTDGAIETAIGAIGEVLAMGDLCDWNFSAKAEKLLQDGAKALQLNAAQLKDVRARIAETRQATFGRFSAAGQARLRVEVCKPEERVRLETMIGRISFE